MAIDLPKDASEMIGRLKADIQGNLPKSNPYLKNSLIGAITISIGRRFFDVYENLAEQQKQFFPQSATGTYLDYWGALRGVTQSAPTFSQGDVMFQGTIEGSTILKGSKISISDSNFTVTTEASLNKNSADILTLTQVGGVAKVIFSNPQPLATGVKVKITGADQAAYNGEFAIEAIASDSFTYDIPPGTLSPATGNIKCEYLYAIVNVQSDKTGTAVNFPSGTKASLQQSVQGVSSDGFVTPKGIEGGADKEDQEQYRDNIISKWQNPVTHFNPGELEAVAKTVNGVTRIFVMRTTNGISPGGQYASDSPGYTTVYVVTDNQASGIIPPSIILDKVKSAFLDIAPVGVGKNNILVLAPSSKPVDFNISDIVPDSSTMREAIKNSLDSFFRSKNTMNGVGTNAPTGTLTINQINAVIMETVDQASGLSLKSYKLNTPNPCPTSGSSDITVKDGEILTLGSVGFL